ncbi:MAG: PaaX family transcriptional regulator C-terminal domain-containing protein [Jhaorihella sp.]
MAPPVLPGYSAAMKDDPDRWFPACVERLTDPHNLRVWSIIVSLFGDLAQGSGDRLSGGALTRIIGPMGIKPEAIRVALHRLRKDGWLQSERTGRESQHFLTGFGRAQSAAVTPRIYTRTPEAAADWHVLIADEAAGIQTLDDLLLTENHISVARNVALGAGPVPGDADDILAFAVTPKTVPDWMKSRVCPPELCRACQSLLDDLVAAGAVLTPMTAPTRLQAATLRTLIVHRWRRVVLRHADLPRAYFPADWPGPACREQVFRLLDMLPCPALPALEAECAS